MVFRDFRKCTGKGEIPRNCTLIPPPGIGITLKTGISLISTIHPTVIPTLNPVNGSLIPLVCKPVNQCVTNMADQNQEFAPTGDKLVRN